MNRQERQESQEWRGSIKNRQNCPALSKYTQSYLLILACGAGVFIPINERLGAIKPPHRTQAGSFVQGAREGLLI
jgi:hypothetical protein